MAHTHVSSEAPDPRATGATVASQVLLNNPFLLECILLWLAVDDLADLATKFRVCRHWHAFMSSSPVLRQALYLRPLPPAAIARLHRKCVKRVRDNNLKTVPLKQVPQGKAPNDAHNMQQSIALMDCADTSIPAGVSEDTIPKMPNHSHVILASDAKLNPLLLKILEDRHIKTSIPSFPHRRTLVYAPLLGYNWGTPSTTQNPGVKHWQRRYLQKVPSLWRRMYASQPPSRILTIATPRSWHSPSENSGWYKSSFNPSRAGRVAGGHWDCLDVTEGKDIADKEMGAPHENEFKTVYRGDGVAIGTLLDTLEANAPRLMGWFFVTSSPPIHGNFEENTSLEDQI